jgi:hypothetical protein
MKGHLMKLKITFSQVPMLPPIRGINILPDYRSIDESEKYSVTYDLKKDCTTTEKFTRMINAIQNAPIPANDEIGYATAKCEHNFYPTIQVDTFIKMKQKMNWIIRELTARDDVPPPEKWLVLDEKSLDTEVLKLNALHLYFEDVTKSVLTQDSLRDSPEFDEFSLLYNHLEEINQLVHSMENWEDSGSNREFFGTIRLGDHCGTPHLENLTDKDYNNFTKDLKWGDLTLDYFRVGKDLQTCYATNDLELVKTKGLEQQITVHPAFEMRFKDDGNWRDHIPNWIEENNLDQYYDFSLPEFNSGRIVLGKLDLTGTNKENVLEEMLKCTGITNIELEDE